MYELREMFYTPEYEINVPILTFKTKEDAEKFDLNRNNIVLLSYDLINKQLLLDFIIGKTKWTRALTDSEIKVFHVKQEAKNKSVLECTDFNPVDIKIQDFYKYPKLLNETDNYCSVFTQIEQIQNLN